MDAINQNLFEAIDRITGHVALESEMREIIEAIKKDYRKKYTHEVVSNIAGMRYGGSGIWLSSQAVFQQGFNYAIDYL